MEAAATAMAVVTAADVINALRDRIGCEQHSLSKSSLIY